MPAVLPLDEPMELGELVDERYYEALSPNSLAERIFFRDVPQYLPGLPQNLPGRVAKTPSWMSASAHLSGSRSSLIRPLKVPSSHSESRPRRRNFELNVAPTFSPLEGARNRLILQ